MMNIPGYTFPVEEFLMEDVVEMIGCVSPRPSLVVAVMSTGARNIICEHRSVQRYAHDVTIYTERGRQRFAFSGEKLFTIQRRRYWNCCRQFVRVHFS